MCVCGGGSSDLGLHCLHRFVCQNNCTIRKVMFGVHMNSKDPDQL